MLIQEGRIQRVFVDEHGVATLPDDRKVPVAGLRAGVYDTHVTRDPEREGQLVGVVWSGAGDVRIPLGNANTVNHPGDSSYFGKYFADGGR